MRIRPVQNKKEAEMAIMEAFVAMEHLAKATARLGIAHEEAILKAFDELVEAAKLKAFEWSVSDLPDLHFELIGYGGDERVSRLALAGRAMRLAQALQGVQGQEGGH